jgi:hypothetical protein
MDYMFRILLYTISKVYAKKFSIFRPFFIFVRTVAGQLTGQFTSKTN